MVGLANIRQCFEGIIPSVLATCSREGAPNISYISNVHYVDESHVALTFQFFNKTHQNVLENPHATINLIDPISADEYCLHLLYRRTESLGPLFEEMKAKLASIAEISGMQSVFKLKGADVYKVLSIEQVSKTAEVAQSCEGEVFKLRNLFNTLNQIDELATLSELILKQMQEKFGYEHAMLLLADDNNEFLYTFDSIGYSESGVGSEVPFGVGSIGISAKHQIPVRIVHTAAEYSYLKSVDRYTCQQKVTSLERDINFPGLRNPHSQMAIPIIVGKRTLGVMYLESMDDLRFNFQDEDLVLTICAYFGQRMIAIQGDEYKRYDLRPLYTDYAENLKPSLSDPANASKENLQVRYFPHDGSIFLGQEYLIKGVAGKILWRLLELSYQEKRHAFSNRELRLDKNLKLPEVGDNLEARLILLRRRLEDKSKDIRLIPVKRGVFELKLHIKVDLQLVSHAD